MKKRYLTKHCLTVLEPGYNDNNTVLVCPKKSSLNILLSTLSFIGFKAVEVKVDNVDEYDRYRNGLCSLIVTNMPLSDFLANIEHF